jgi:hypothetical protein
VHPTHKSLPPIPRTNSRANSRAIRIRQIRQIRATRDHFFTARIKQKITPEITPENKRILCQKPIAPDPGFRCNFPFDFHASTTRKTHPFSHPFFH